MYGMLTYVDGEKTVCCALMLMALKFSGQSKWHAQWSHIQSTKNQWKHWKF